MYLNEYILNKAKDLKELVEKEEYIKKTLELYEKTKKINKDNHKYKDIFIYGIKIRDTSACELKKEEYEAIQDTVSVFIFLGEDSNYHKLYLTAEGYKTNEEGKKELKLRDCNNIEYCYDKNVIKRSDSESKEYKMVLRISEGVKKRLLKTKFLILGEYILNYKDNTIYINRLIEVKSRYKLNTLKQLILFINLFINQLCSEKQEIKTNAESKLNQITDSIGKEFYRMVYLMAGVEKNLIISTKNSGYEYLLRDTDFEKSPIRIPKKLLEEHEDILQKGIVLLLLYNAVNNLMGMVNLQPYFDAIKNQKIIYEMFEDDLSKIKNEYNKCIEEYLISEISSFYEDILNDFTEVICKGFRIKNCMPEYESRRFNDIKNNLKQIKSSLIELEEYLKQNDSEVYNSDYDYVFQENENQDEQD